MSAYLAVKWIHIVSSVLLVGTGLGTAYFFFFTNRSHNVQAIAVVARLVVRADWWFTLPAAIAQPVTGVMLAASAGWPLATPWIALSLVLYLLAGACWLPVVWIQIRMAPLAEVAAANALELPAAYHVLGRRWEWLGCPAFTAMLIAFWLMVAKPATWPWS
jgi:uncharacterized membrane protein